MDRITRLQKKELQLKKELEELNLRKKELEREIEGTKEEIGVSYESWYESKRNKEFILYENFPSIKSFNYYNAYVSSKFPLYEYGKLNVKELATIIKHLYQFKTNEEFNILTIGTLEDLECVTPHVHFLIGNEKTLSQFHPYDKTFSYDRHLNYAVDNVRNKSLISIDLENLGEFDTPSKAIDLECYTKTKGFYIPDNPWERDRKGFINYIDNTQILTQRRSTRMGLEKQIFSSTITRTKLSQRRNMTEFFDFFIHQNDTYIAKVLISIVIYKRNNHLLELTEEDYNHIFDVLWKEKVNIKEEAEKDFPRILKYIAK